MTNAFAIALLKQDIQNSKINISYRHNEVGIKALELAIKALEQESKTGHWEYVQYDSNPNIGNWHCSECRGICTEMHSIEDAYNYCPSCGAKMEVEE